MIPRLVLASGSPARLATLRSAGLDPEVVVPDVPEEPLPGEGPADLCARLAEAKALAVAADLNGAVLVLGCDTVLDLDGEAYGKPANSAEAVRRWRRMRGRTGLLRTGHCLYDLRTEDKGVHVESTVVHFADVSDAEIEAYVATGEPLRVAGGFTIDGLGGAFVRAIEGDPHNVVGISLPIVRDMVLRRGVDWLSMWATPPAGPGSGR